MGCGENGVAMRDNPTYRRCETCLWFIKDAVAHGIIGRCRRHAPLLSEQIGSGYPMTNNLDWCGDHKLGDPEKRK